MAQRVYVVFVTAPRGKGEEIARRLVEERLAACVNVVSGVKSIYWWQGKVESDAEDLLVVKTNADVLDKLITRVREIHPYEIPEVIALPVEKGLPEYLAWVVEETRGE